MHQDIQEHLYRMIDDYVYVEELNNLLKSFIADKVQEQSLWAEITLCTHNMLGGEIVDIRRYAAVTELVNLTLDIVDDLQDQDQANKSWMQSPQASTLNAILAMLMGVVGELGQLQVHGKLLVEITQIIARSINGQHKDIINASVSVDDYLVMTQEKSGSLFRLACFMGYLSLDCPDETIKQLHELADCIGLIHQIQNDMRDLVRYDVKNDLYFKKRTLPILYLLSVEDEAFKPLKDYYAGKITADSLLHDKEAFNQMIHDSGCLEYSRVVQSICLQKAEEIYAKLQAASPWKEKFREITYGDFLHA
ncbi:polyprenyl synthetase family protein [Paenibacillus alba]|uniref:Polyprenyl synthetase family protein n=1 Tax=Paenibacillus alba TaxID=1197127 RepID=A0ABU6G0X7_9BACL|nr:polyprenyl synthetase family protein [Paenibacillus alba]MEC0227309.1 polyprenyl synthetase family protein [Paenibacillus alba]